MLRILFSLFLFCMSINAYASDLGPFFVSGGNEDSVQPDIPSMTNLDKGIVKICGEFGSFVSSKKFLRMLSSKNVRSDVEVIINATDHTVFEKTNNFDEYLTQLTKLFFRGKNSPLFTHVFCGELDSDNTLGGLHFAPRLYDLQKRGVAGIAQDTKDCKSSLKNGVLNLHVGYLQRDGVIGHKCIDSYVPKINAIDMIIGIVEGNKFYMDSEIYKNNKPSVVECMKEISDSQHRKYWYTFHYRHFYDRKKDKSITVYPIQDDIKSEYCNLKTSRK